MRSKGLPLLKNNNVNITLPPNPIGQHMPPKSKSFGFGLNDRDATRSPYDKFDPKDGQNYLLSFGWYNAITLNEDEEPVEMAWPPEEGAFTIEDSFIPKFVSRDRYYIKSGDKTLCVADNGSPELGLLAGEPPSTAIATVVVVWPITNGKNPQVDKDAVMRGEYEILPWIFSSAKYQELYMIHQNSSFAKNDLAVTAKGAGKQRKISQAARTQNTLRNLLSSSNPKAQAIGQQIIRDVEAFVKYDADGEAVGLLDMIAKNMSLDKVRDRLGIQNQTTLVKGGDLQAFSSALDDVADL